MNNKPDYKKSYFEKRLNSECVSKNAIIRVMRQFGYHYEYDNGRYYVYTQYEWNVKQKFDQTIRPILHHFLG